MGKQWMTSSGLKGGMSAIASFRLIHIYFAYIISQAQPPDKSHLSGTCMGDVHGGGDKYAGAP